MKYKAMDSITDKTYQLIERICKLSEELPEEETYRLKDRLNSAVIEMPEHIREAFKKEKRIDKIRSMIKVDNQITEAKCTLDMVNRLKYSDTNDLMNELDEVNDNLKTECRIAYTA